MPALRVLIAGSGDLGRRIARGLREDGAAVRAIARHPRPHDPSVLACDLTQPIARGFAGTCDVLVHCLAPATRDEATYRAVYVDALRHLLAALPDTGRIVFVSSTAVYGDHAGRWVDESTTCQPIGFNGRILLEAEDAARSCGRDALVLRLGGLYGPGRDMLLRRVRAGAPLPVSEPPLYTNRIHVDDAAAAAVHLMRQRATGLFNLVDAAPVAQPEVLDWIADRLALPRLSRIDGPPPADNKRVDSTRLRATGFQLRYPDFRAGYAALLDGVMAAPQE